MPSVTGIMVYNYIFDLFGTLVTEDGYLPMMESLFPEVKYESLNSFLNVTHFHSVEWCVQRIGSKFNLFIDKEREEKIIKTTQEWVDSRKLYPHAKEVLAELRLQRSKIGLISNNNTLIESVFSMLTLNDYFETIIFSHQVKYIKPKEEIYQICQSLLDVDYSTLIMVGNQLEKDVLKPQELGMNGVLFDPQKKSNYFPRITSLLELVDYVPQ